MYLSRLYIKNFRSIRLLDISFSAGKNVIVGRNNSGKSNIIKAIDLMLGEYSPTYHKSENVTENDFFQGETSNPVFIWCELNRISVGDMLEPLNDEELAKVTFYRLLQGANYDPVSILVGEFSDKQIANLFYYSSEEANRLIDQQGSGYRKFWIGNKSYCRRTVPVEFAEIDRFALAFRCIYQGEGKLQKDLAFFYKKSSEIEWIEASSSNLRSALMQSAIIPSFRDPKDQLRITNYSWFGKLLKKYVVTDSEDLSSAFSAVKTASDRLFESLRSVVGDEKINIAFPNTSISFQFNPGTKQDIHRSTLIYVDDGFNSELKDKGAGIQSAITIALFDFYIRNIAHSTSSLLAIEEPELYLHPHGRRVVADRFSSFSNAGRNQVILTTHSSEFISNVEDAVTIISVRKDEEGTRATNISFADPKRRQILIKKQNAEMFFSDAVILTEGADKYFVQASAKLFASKRWIVKDEDAGNTELSAGENMSKTLSLNWLNEYNVSVLNCGGKAELYKYAQILREVNIPFITTADFDFLRDGLNTYFTRLDFSQPVIDQANALKSRISSSIGGVRYKDISAIKDDEIKKEVLLYLELLRDYNIFLFSGELEHFYIEQPKFDKEAGVLETLGKCIEHGVELSEYVEVKEYFDLLDFFSKNILNLKLEEVRQMAASPAPHE
jgi:putative ATP-dependent endonuclease of the OLD family